MNELLNLVTQARQDANAGNLTPERMIELLAMMEDHLTEEQQAKLAAAVGSLSYSELKAITFIAKEVPGQGGLVVASVIADGAGITRSVIVGALRKLEAAGVVQSNSLGMKGTMIRTLVPGWQEAVIKKAA